MAVPKVWFKVVAAIRTSNRNKQGNNATLPTNSSATFATSPPSSSQSLHRRSGSSASSANSNSGVENNLLLSPDIITLDYTAPSGSLSARTAALHFLESVQVVAAAARPPPLAPHYHLNNNNNNNYAAVPIGMPSGSSPPPPSAPTATTTIPAPPPNTMLPPTPTAVLYRRGKCPSGTMRYKASSTSLVTGNTSSPLWIEIEYSVPSGVQADFHAHPGHPFFGFGITSPCRIAYVPNTGEGRLLLARIIVAWNRGLIFTVGKSATTGLDDSVVWSGLVPHKTKVRIVVADGTSNSTTITPRDPFALPDPDYVAACNAALDAIGIPCTNLPSITIPDNNREVGSVEISYQAPATAAALAAADGSAPWAVGSGPSPPASVPSSSGNRGNHATRTPATGSTASHVEDDDEDNGPTCYLCYEPLHEAPWQRQQCTVAGSTEVTAVRIPACQHAFHTECLVHVWEYQQQNHCHEVAPTTTTPTIKGDSNINNQVSQYDCPCCHTLVPMGMSPSGTLTIKQHSTKSTTTSPATPTPFLSLTFKMPNGTTQQLYHPKPGHSYKGCHRAAFVPNTKDGRALAGRLAFAFRHGMSFTIGYSDALKEDDQCKWTSAYVHKTNIDKGGRFGLPDDKYIYQCHDALDRLGVPEKCPLSLSFSS